MRGVVVQIAPGVGAEAAVRPAPHLGPDQGPTLVPHEEHYAWGGLMG